MDIRNEDVAVNKFKSHSIIDESNKVYVLGELLGIEEEGDYNGIPHWICLMKTERGNNKPQYVWVLLPKHEDTYDLIINHSKVFIEGQMNSSYSFNDKAVSHTFISPDSIYKLSEDVEFEKDNDFHWNYTLNNRVVLEGIVDKAPWKEFIPPANHYVTRFSLAYEYKGKVRSMYCTLWDTVNDLDDLKEGKRLKVLGSFSLLKKERGLEIKDGYVTQSRKNKLDSYVIVVQKAISLDDGDVGETVKSLIK